MNDDLLSFDWNIDENMKAVMQQVKEILKGRELKTGCRTQQCGCKAKGKQCSEGCECTDSSNVHTTPGHAQHNTDTLMEVTIEETVADNDPDQEVEGVDEIMDWVFGCASADEDITDDKELEVSNLED